MNFFLRFSSLFLMCWSFSFTYSLRLETSLREEEKKKQSEIIS